METCGALIKEYTKPDESVGGKATADVIKEHFICIRSYAPPQNTHTSTTEHRRAQALLQ